MPARITRKREIPHSGLWLAETSQQQPISQSTWKVKVHCTIVYRVLESFTCDVFYSCFLLIFHALMPSLFHALHPLETIRAINDNVYQHSLFTS